MSIVATPEQLQHQNNVFAVISCSTTNITKSKKKKYSNSIST